MIGFYGVVQSPRSWKYILPLSILERPLMVGLFGWLVSYRPRQQLSYVATGSQDWHLTILRAATHKTEWRDNDFCLSRSHYTDTDPTSRERAATAGIEPRTSTPGVAHSTDCNIIILYEPFLNQMWPRHGVSCSCQEYVSNEILWIN